MAITPDGWLDWAVRAPGRPQKVNGGRNGLLGLAFHSAEGWETYLREYQYLPKYADRRASWHFSNLRSGVLLQHYPIYEQTWTSGAAFPNNNMPGCETEGIAGQPLNEKQEHNAARIITDVSALTGRKPVRNPGVTIPNGVLAIVEHSECKQWGAEPTACPSGRYNWPRIFSLLGEGDDMYHVHDGWGLHGFAMNAGDRHSVNAREVFSVPEQAQSIDLEFFSREGYVVVRHGSVASADPRAGQAGRVGWGRIDDTGRSVADGYSRCRVALDGAGCFELWAEDPNNPPFFHTVHVSGWYD